MKLPTLYKLSNRGKIEEWDIETIPAITASEIVVIWGMQGGKKQEKRETIIEGKNIGRANETTPQEQADLEAKSKWEKQKDKGYFEEIPTKRKIRPMLAKVYGDHKHKLTFPVFVQPKLDGMRALAFYRDGKVGMMSRKGKEINTAEHIQKDLESFFKDQPDAIFDGELYKHGEAFQKIISAVKRDDANEASKEIEYHIYDCFYPKVLNLEFVGRNAVIETLFRKLNPVNLKYVETNVCFIEEQIFEAHQKYLKLGYEGSIVRNNASYEIDKRSSNLLKLKEFQDGEFQIVGCEEDKNGHAVFWCQTKGAGATFKVKPEGDDEYRKQLYKDRIKYSGKMLTVRFFEWTTSISAVPRFPVGIAIRDYE